MRFCLQTICWPSLMDQGPQNDREKMKYLSRDDHYKKLKANFRSRAKQAAADFLIQKLWQTRQKIAQNKTTLMLLHREQGELKRDHAAMCSLLDEFKK